MKLNKIIIIVTNLFVFTSLLIACTKSKNYYDGQFYQLHKNVACTEEWRNVLRCDGKRYGNECQVNAQGIRLR
jgi:hypothetical protein